MSGLTFNVLRDANVARMPQFKNKHGTPAHSQADGSDWSDAQWFEALAGEVGEYANLHKKLVRGDLTQKEFTVAAAEELADIATYLDILAFRLGIDLGAAVIRKFNAVSRRVNSTVYLHASGNGLSVLAQSLP